ncbi:MAG TPA: phospholipid carrier-dependent glycosyltransferase [Micromonosporaceae bacterium]|nr:phospholipid carrier-dependent glycosyltransferase [Micromonosporaceae bacterium]
MVRRRLGPYLVSQREYAWSWAATLLVTLLAGAIRVIGLDTPKGKIFDEVYYATEGWALINHGVEWNEKENTGAYVVHPPLGKWFIGLGEWIFGYDEFGWRIAAAVAGTLSVLIMVRLARAMFRSTVLGCAAGLLMAFDGMHFVLSRSALLDIFLMTFVLGAFAALVFDREQRRRRWLSALEGGLDPTRRGRAGRPAMGAPWLRLLAAVLLGCALGVKWSAVFFIPAFALLMILWDVRTRRSAGVPRPWLGTLAAETGWLLLCGVLIVATYVVTWSGWFLTDDGYFRHWLADNGRREWPVVGPLWNLVHYHLQALDFHTGLDSRHQYQSWPWQWLLLGRPVAFHWSSDGPCGAPSCASEVLLLGTPVLWWSMLPALAALAWLGIARRDWRAGAIWLSVAVALGPWFYYALQGRTMFYFYALPAEPFLILAIVYVLGAIMVPARGAPDEGRRLLGAIVTGAYVLLVAACFAWFYPVYVGQTIPYPDWHVRMWLGGRWI